MLVYCCYKVRGWDALLLLIDFRFQYCRVAKNQIQRYCVPWQSVGFLPPAFMKWLDLDPLKLRLRLLWSWQCIFRCLCFQPHCCKCGVTLTFSWLYSIVYLLLNLKFYLITFQGFCLMLDFSTGLPSWTWKVKIYAVSQKLLFPPHSARYVRGFLFPWRILVLKY